MTFKPSRLLLTTIITTTLLTTAGTSILAGRTTPPIEWEKTYGSSKIDFGYCVQQTTDLGYIITGAYGRNLFSPWNGYLYLLKVDAQGNEQWHQTHGTANYENVGKAVRQTTDGGYIIAGYTGYTYHLDGLVEKTNETGTITWSHTYGNVNEADRCNDVQQTSDGGYIICGLTGSYGAGGGDAWLIKLQPNGTEAWNHTYGGTQLDQANSVLQTTDGGYILAGSTFSYGNGGDLWILKTDPNGTELWNQTIGGPDYDEALCISPTTDNGYILTGSTQNYGTGGGDVWLLKTDLNGTEQWNTTFGGIYLDAGNSVQQTPDGGYFITGQYSNQTTNTPDFYIIKTTPDGSLDWQQIIDNQGADDYANDGITTADGGYIITGNSGPSQTENVDVYLIKYQGTNNPPYTPSNPTPADNATNQPLTLNLTWTGGDPDGGPVYYTLALGTTTTPPTIATNLTTTSFHLDTLQANTTYYWQITATDPYGATTTGPLWHFTTKALPILELSTLTGKIGIHTAITNTGTIEANHITWNITVTGGHFNHVNTSIQNTIPILHPGTTVPITTGLFFGLGQIAIKITVTCDENPTPLVKLATAKITLVWVKILT